LYDVYKNLVTVATTVILECGFTFLIPTYSADISFVTFAVLSENYMTDYHI